MIVTAPRRPDVYVAARPWGLGDAASSVQQGVGIGTPVVLAGVSAEAASAAAATGTAATILGMAPALAIPIIGAAIAGVTIAIVAILRSGCGKACVITSTWADQAEGLLKQNIQAYFSNPAPRTNAQKAVALANFDSIWNYLVAQCRSVPGAPGQNCISDRQAGACKWKQAAGAASLQWPGEPQVGECWNWFLGYRSPIANDPTVDSVTSDISAAVTGAASSLGVSSPVLWLAAAGLVAWAVLS